MTGITHTQAGRYMRKALDGLLTDAQRRDLQTHLDECAACRLESESFSSLTAHLKTEFQARWDTQHGPSQNVMANVQSQTRRIIMKKRIDFAFNLLGGAAALLVLFFVVTTVISQFQKKSTPANGNNNPNSLTVQEAQALAGFDVLVPSYLPEGYNFQGAAYDPKVQEVTLKYISSPGDANYMGIISIYQILGDFPKAPSPLPYTTPVPVRNVTGEFTHGVWVYDSPNATTPRWEGDNDYYALSWQKDGISYMIDFLGGILTPPVELNGLTAIAESLKSASTDTAQRILPIATNKSNGEWIAFIGKIQNSTALGESQDVFMIHPDGSGLTKLTGSENPVNYYNLQWSPDGKNLLVLREHDGKIDILRTSQYGGEVLTRPITDPDHYGGYSWSPNSDKIVFVDSTNGNYEIYTMYADGRNDPQRRQLTNDPANDVGFVWSPDGSQIAFERLNGDQLSVYVMNEDGSNQREVARGMGKVNLRWSLDGMSIYASTGTESDWLDCETCIHKPGIYRIYLTGSVQVHQVYAEQAASKVDGWYLYDTPQNMLYFMRIDQSAFLNFQGNWMQFDGNSVRELGASDPHQTCKTTTGNILGEHISPNERFSVITNACAGGFDLYLADREAITPKQKLSHLIKLPLSTYGQGGDGAYLPINWSPDGRWLIYDDGNQSINLLNLEKTIQDPTTEPSTLFHSESNTFMPSEFTWQPALANQVVEQKPTPEPTQTSSYNGLIVFASEATNVSNAERNVDIYTMHPDGSDITNLTNNPANDTSPVWSPDGKKIVFTGERTGNANIFVMNPDGSGVTQLTDNPGYDGNIYGNISWSPDGQKIVYSAIANDPNAQSQLVIMNADGLNKVVLTQEAGSYSFLSWSPDGQKVVYQKDSTDPNGSSANVSIYSANIDGTNQRELFKGGGITSMRWEDASNFSGIVYTQLDNANWYLYRFNIDGTPAELLGSSPTPIDGWLIEGSKTIYITKNTTTWLWHDNQKKVSDWTKWNFASDCKNYSPIDVFTHDATYVASPDGKRLFVIVTCDEEISHFYLVSADGSEIKELANMPTPITWQALNTTWSPDEKYIIMTSSVAEPSNESATMDFYLFDIEKMQNDSSTKPIQLTTDKAFKFSPSWQPQP